MNNPGWHYLPNPIHYHDGKGFAICGAMTKGGKPIDANPEITRNISKITCGECKKKLFDKGIISVPLS